MTKIIYEHENELDQKRAKRICFLILHALSGLKTKLTMCMKATGNTQKETYKCEKGVQNSKVAASYGNQYENLLIKNCACDHL